MASRSAAYAGQLPGGGRRRGTGWLDWMVVPAVLVLAVVIAYPTVQSVLLSGLNYELTDPTSIRAVGAGNYLRLARDPVFWTALENTVLFTGVSVALGVVLGLAIALLADGLPPRLRFLQGALLAPWAVPVIVVAFLFRYMFDQQVGVVNYLLGLVHLVAASQPWLSSVQLAMPAVVVANVWSQTPFYVLMFLAGLKGIPDDVRDAARMDGATGWAEFQHVLLPFLRNTVVVASLLMIIGNFNNFPLIWAMTGGGPVYATTTLVVYIFELAFTQFNIGYAATMGTIWLLVLLTLAVVYIRALAREPLEAAGG